MAQGSPSKGGAPAGPGMWASDHSVQVSFWRNLRWSFLPPLGVYAVASGMALTNVVGVFVIKDYLNLSAAFVASLGFWIGLPWATKIIFGHLVDLIWLYRNALIVLGAAAISLSNYLIYALLTGAHDLTSVMSVETWFIEASVLAPVGYVLQDVVADAMPVEAVSNVDDDGHRDDAAAGCPDRSRIDRRLDQRLQGQPLALRAKNALALRVHYRSNRNRLSVQ